MVNPTTPSRGRCRCADTMDAWQPHASARRTPRTSLFTWLICSAACRAGVSFCSQNYPALALPLAQLLDAACFLPHIQG